MICNFNKAIDTTQFRLENWWPKWPRKPTTLWQRSYSYDHLKYTNRSSCVAVILLVAQRSRNNLHPVPRVKMPISFPKCKIAIPGFPWKYKGTQNAPARNPATPQEANLKVGAGKVIAVTVAVIKVTLLGLAALNIPAWRLATWCTTGRLSANWCGVFQYVATWYAASKPEIQINFWITST